MWPQNGQIPLRKIDTIFFVKVKPKDKKYVGCPFFYKENLLCDMCSYTIFSFLKYSPITKSFILVYLQFSVRHATFNSSKIVEFSK